MQKRAKVLVADDEAEIREVLAEIVSEFHQTILASNGAEALRAAKEKRPDAVILDCRMPDLDGIEVCRRLREDEQTRGIRVIMLSGSNDPDLRVAAFQAGVDDFIVKPVSPRELLARLDSKLRRAYEARTAEIQGSPGRSMADRFLDYERRQLQLKEGPLSLGTIEFRILSNLLQRSGQIMARQELVDIIWENSPSSERALDPHITSLRKKLKASPFDLKTIYGVGYSLILNEVI